MKRREFFPAVATASMGAVSLLEAGEKAVIRIVLDEGNPGQSRLYLQDGDTGGIPVGFGKKGFLPAGEAFQGGYSLLGEFEVNAVLSSDRFEMTDELVQESGKSREWLAENLFFKMSSIDFDGDGKGGEYGDAFIGLAPIHSSAKQPFHFGEYKGVFRWYSYAIHGTQDQARIGKCVTGGCINVGAADLNALTAVLDLNDRVVVQPRG
ncbi:L,D-transpeptidase [Verrucomicrobiales bacterium BCK34]|nr:L,D-transpeptidase [Verrucomicrobiales bacterium BCK34]